MTTSRTRKATSGNDDDATMTDAAEKPAGKKTAKKAAKKTAGSAGGQTAAPRKRASAPRAAAKPKMTAARVASEAARQLMELTGKQSEGVTSLERTDEGWKIQVEVVELRRIPETTDVLAVYELEVDDQGSLEGYHRVRRYTRGAADGG